MPVFSPEFSKVFKTAAFINLNSSTLIVLFRVGILFILFILIFFSLAYIPNLAKLWVGLLAFGLMGEYFYHFSVLDTTPRLKINELSENSNLAESFTLHAAQSFLKAGDWNSVSPILKGLVTDIKVKSFLQKSGFNKDEVDSLIKAGASEPVNTQELLTKAVNYLIKEKREHLDEIDVLLALFEESKALDHAVFTKEIKEPDLLNIAYWVRHLFERQGKHFWEKSVTNFGLGLASLWEGGWTLETEKYSLNITEQIYARGVRNHLVGRGDTILQVEEVLARSTKRNVILMGEPGVGKSTVIYGLAEKSAHGALPGALKFKRFLELDLTSLLSSASRGELEKRISDLLTEISHAPDVVLYIPEIEYLTTIQGGGVDITGLLMSTLQEGNLQIIGTTTLADYRKNIEPKKAFSENFEVVEIPEPDKNASIRILEEAAANIEIRNKIIISYKAIEKAVELSKRYMVDRVLPGKAIDLLDESATASTLQAQKILGPELVEQIISQKTKTPVTLAEGAEAKKLLNLEEELHKRIIDQEEAVKSISEAIRRARTLKQEGTRPIGVFLFLGPTGVGKTETAKALADVYFGSAERIVREDMSEYQEENSINRLLGAPPGTKDSGSGGQFTEKIRSNPFTVVLLDEIEKANPKIQETFLPTFDEGKMEDATGRKIIFTNTIIIATSNAGAEFIRESIQNGQSVYDIKKPLFEKLQKENIFKPEFLNRFDDIVLFKPLSMDEVKQIVKLLTDDLTNRLKGQDIYLSFDDTSLEWLAQKGFDPTYGARPLRRAIQDEIESNLSKRILSGEIIRGSNVSVTVIDGQISFKPQGLTQNSSL